METAFLTVLPVAGIAFLGFLCVKLGYLSQEVADGVARFGAAVVIPLFAFRTMERAGWPSGLGNVLELLGSFYIGALLTLLAGMFLARALFQSGSSGARTVAIGSSHGNVVLLGIPAVLLILGGNLGQVMFILVGLHGVLMAVILSVVTALTDRRLGELVGGVLSAATEQLRNPVLIAIVVGILWNRFDIPLPAAADSLIRTIAAATAPVALFGFGGMIARYEFGAEFGRSFAVSLLKLALHPFLVWLLATKLFSLPGSWVWLAVLLAAMPTTMGIDMTTRRGGESGGSVIALSSLLGIGTLLVLVYIMRTA